MASAVDQIIVGEPAAAHTFKGYPQPPPDERLQECRNYLADEDVNRNLGFKFKLTQIEEYIKELEEKKTPCDPKLLRDVKTMATVQREWMDHFMDARPCDKDPCKSYYNPPISNRLVSKEVGKDLREEKEAMGLANQMREDHAPFTTDRNDQIDFLDKLKKDESENPEMIDEAINLLWVENRAYRWALREPSLIPVWLHPRLGIPNKGIKATDDPPWYRIEGVLPTRRARIRRRPPPQTLPDYLQHAQDTINSLLEDYANGIANEAETAQLEKFLSDFELASLRELREDHERVRQNHLEMVGVSEKNKLNVLEHDIKKAHEAWLFSFAKDGIQLMVGEEPVSNILQPGVFYVPAEQPSAEESARLERVNARANELLNKGPDYLREHLDERAALLALLNPVWPIEMKRLLNDSLELRVIEEAEEEFSERFRKNVSEYAHASDVLLQHFYEPGIQMRYERPGEIISPMPGLVPVPWKPHQPFFPPDHETPEPEEGLRKLESTINNSLRGLDTYPGTLKNREKKELAKQLEKVMYPNLRRMRLAYLKLEADRSAASQEEYDDIKWQYEKTHAAWVNSFLHSGVQIRMPGRFKLDERPGILYLRNPNAATQKLEALDTYKDTADKINFELKKASLSSHDPEDQALYPLLMNLQYPHLKRMDENRRHLSTRNNPTEDEIKEEQAAHRNWQKSYNAWVLSFQNETVVVRHTIEPTDFAGDPSIVYYRGPLPEQDIFGQDPSEQDPPLTRGNIDYALFLSNWYEDIAEDKVGLAARFEKASCLPPSVTDKLKIYTEAQTVVNLAPERQDEQIKRYVAFTKHDLISAFNAWEKEVRALARPSPASRLTPALPPYHQNIENEINRRLEHAKSSSLKERVDLNALIEPYWQPQLAKLQNWRRTRLLEEGKTEDQIELTDMSIGSFAFELEDFKIRCRIRGFNIVEVLEDVFVAQDPDVGDYVSFRQQLEANLNEIATYTHPDLYPPGMNTNEIRELLFNREQEINDLLDIQNRRGGTSTDSSDSDTWRIRTRDEEQRLMDLLRRFFPPRLHTADRQLHALRLLNGYSSGEEQARADQNRADATKAFLDIYEPWIRRLTNTGVHLVLGSGDNLEDIDNGVLYVHYTKAPNLDQTSDEEDDTTYLLSPAFRSMQTEINDLLRSRSSRSLDLDEEKRLRCLLRAVMPQGLARLDGALRTLAQQARSGPLSPQDMIDYFTVSEWWRDEYYSWLNEFTKKGVRLKMRASGESPPPPTSNIMFLQISASTEIPNDPTDSPSLPDHVQMRQELLNCFLSGDSSLDSNEELECARYLYSFWRPTVDVVCQNWMDRLYQEYKIQPRETEGEASTRLQAVVEAQLRNSFSCFLGRTIGSPQKLHLRFVEVQPEAFSIVLAPLKYDGAIENENMLKDIINNALTLVDADNKIPKPLDLALKEFLPLAQKVRDLQTSLSAPALTEEERKQVETFLQPLSYPSIITMEKEVQTLWQYLVIHRHLSRVDQERLKDLSVKQMWVIWGSRNPDIRDSTLQSVNQPDPVGTLLNPEPGATRPRPPTIDPPTEADIVNLEIMVNGLIENFTKSRSSMTTLEWSKIKWLLGPLNPPKLRNIDRQMRQLVSKSGLDFNESLKLSEFEKQYNILFYGWMEKIENFGKLLDSWWFNRMTMQQLFICTRMWEMATKTDAEDKSNTQAHHDAPDSTDILDETLAGPKVTKDPTTRAQQENVELLRLFTENYEGGYQNRLLLENMPPPLKSLYEEIDGLRDRSRSSPLELVESVRLRTVTRDFVRDHMNWISGLTAEQIQTLRGNAVNFSAKAERRGVQRAAVELGLNLLATNQEQHRPHDRFRRLRLPPKYQPHPDEVPLWKPLDQWKRPVELDPYYYTKLMRKFRRWKDDDYAKALNDVTNEQPGQLHPPANYNGPFTPQNSHEIQQTASERQNHLGQIGAQLVRTVGTAPRPLLKRICALMGEAINSSSNEPHLMRDDIPLTMGDLDLLTELCEASWTLNEGPYGEHLAGFSDQDPDLSLEKAGLQEFEKDVMNATIADHDPRPLVPFWTPPPLPASQIAYPDSDASFTQRQYDKSVTSQAGVELRGGGGLIQRLNGQRLARAGKNYTPQAWATDHIQRYLQAMHDSGRIHFDVVEQRVSRIPLSGHPENKYVLSEDDAKRASYITFNNDTKKYEVQYDSSGTVGPPIVQPNKYEHFQRIAFRLGRDIRLLSELVADYGSNATRLQKQSQALNRTLQHMKEINPGHASGTVDPITGKELSLKMIARDLARHAPELLKDINMERDISTITEEEAAQIIQLQLIEESNNNWESRFPEDEHVWDWVDDPLPTTQPADGATPLSSTHDAYNTTRRYFSMRRWPVECQSTSLQAMIKTSGPPLDTDISTTQIQTVQQAPTLIAAQKRRAAIGPYPRERYTGRGGPPNFPFGETPVQQSYKSFEIVRDLEGVPEFRDPPPPKGIINTLKRKWGTFEPPPGDQFTLPEIPPEWNPTNVSMTEKRDDVIEKAKQTSGFLAKDEAYYTPAAIVQKKHHRAIEHATRERLRAKAKIAERAGIPYSHLSQAELVHWQQALNIDPLTEEERPDPKKARSERNRGATTAQSFGVDEATVSGPLGSGDAAAAPSGPGKGRSASTPDAVTRKLRPGPGPSKRGKSSETPGASEKPLSLRKRKTSLGAGGTSEIAQSRKRPKTKRPTVEEITDKYLGT